MARGPLDPRADLVRVNLPEASRANLHRILNDGFMKKYTKCENLEAFMFSSAVFVNWEDETLVYSEERLDAFVAETTQFKSWMEMLGKAAEEY